MSTVRRFLPILALPAALWVPCVPCVPCVLWATSGCGARSTATPAIPLQSGGNAASTETSPDGSEILLWGRVGDEAPKTYRIASDGSGKVMEEMVGIWIATSKGELHLVTTSKPIVLEGCREEEGGPAIGPGGEGRLSLVELKTPEGRIAQTIIDAKFTGTLDVDQMEHDASVIGTIGTVIFIHESTFLYACGAHGNTSAGFLTWDAEVGAPVELLDAIPNKAELAKLAAKDMNERFHEDDSLHEDDHPELVQLVPTYGPRGALMLEPQLTRSACYACSDGLWSSYSQSAVLESSFLPERFKAFSVPPVSVKVFLDAHPGFSLGGYSRR